MVDHPIEDQISDRGRCVLFRPMNNLSTHIKGMVLDPVELTDYSSQSGILEAPPYFAFLNFLVAVSVTTSFHSEDASSS